jgi:hypothetical protein
MNRTFGVLIVSISLMVGCDEIFAAQLGTAPGFAPFKGSQPAARLSTSSGLPASVRPPGVHPSVRGRAIPLHFADRTQRLHDPRVFPHPDFHRFFRRHPRFHRGFFFGYPIIGLAPSSVLISSYSGMVGNVPGSAYEEMPSERPLISIMLHYRRDLGLSAQQVHELEQIRATYQRKAIRYDADLRIAESEVQSLLNMDPVDLEVVREKLESTERLKVEMRLAWFAAIEQGKALLSPDQRAQLSALLGDAQ